MVYVRLEPYDFQIGGRPGALKLPILIGKGPEEPEAFVMERALAAQYVLTHGERVSGGYLVPIRLIPRPDNPWNPLAVSICVRPNKKSLDERLLGYIFDNYVGRNGQKLIHTLARYSGGEVECGAILERDGSFVALALPPPAVLLSEIRSYLADPARARLEFMPKLTDLLKITIEQKVDPAPEALELIKNFQGEKPKIGALRLESMGISTASNRQRARALYVNDQHRGTIGQLIGGLLILNDERDRLAVLRELPDFGIRAQKPLPARHTPESLVSAGWAKGKIPNIWCRWREEGIDLYPRNPEAPNDRWSVAEFNPLTRTLYVEHPKLEAPCTEYVFRLGLRVDRTVLPKRPWNLDNEIPYAVRRALDLRPPGDAYHTGLRQIRRTLRSSKAAAVIPVSEVEWIDSIEDTTGPTVASAEFVLYEKFVANRVVIFPDMKVTGTYNPCRLCFRLGSELITKACTSPVTYCQACLDDAWHGKFRSAPHSAKALRFLTKHEFDGVAPLEEQITAIRFNPRKPFTPDELDALMLCRFAVKSKTEAWSKLLHRAGLLKNGRRSGRGIVIEAEDGHLCLSMLEKTVDDFLHQNGIEHEREPRYPAGIDVNKKQRWRADWLLSDGTFVELWGMPDDARYAARMQEKISLAESQGISLLGLRPSDLSRLEELFDPWLRGTVAS